MDSYPATTIARHEYRLKTWQRGFLLTFGSLMIGGSVAISVMLMGQNNAVTAPLIALIFVPIGIYLVFMALRSRIVIEGSRIEVCSGFSTRSADLRDIEGYRTFSSRNGTYTKLYFKQDRRSITMSNSFDTDDDFRGWFQQVPDLDARDRQHILDEIAQQQDLGATPAERLAALSSAKTYSIAALVIAAAVALIANIVDSQALQIPAVIFLALVPVGVGMMIYRAPLLYAIYKRKSDPRGEVSFPFMIAGFGLFFRNREVHMVSMQPLWLLVAFVAVVYFGGLLRFTTGNSGSSSPLSTFLALLFFVGPYAYSLPIVIDTLADKSPVTVHDVQVTGKHITHGKSTSYYLELAPWGPVTSPGSLTVSQDLYNSFSPGDQICLALHDGRLHAPWYAPVPCAISPDFTQ